MAQQIGKRQLMAKARGFTTSISKLSKDERLSSPSGSYGEDYNRLRAAVVKLYAYLGDILPPNVDIERSAMTGGSFTYQSYAEINTYCEQIYEILNEQLD